MPDEKDKDKATETRRARCTPTRRGDEDQIKGDVMDEGEAPDAEEAADDAATKSGEPSGIDPGGR